MKIDIGKGQSVSSFRRKEWVIKFLKKNSDDQTEAIRVEKMVYELMNEEDGMKEILEFKENNNDILVALDRVDSVGEKKRQRLGELLYKYQKLVIIPV